MGANRGSRNGHARDFAFHVKFTATLVKKPVYSWVLSRTPQICTSHERRDSMPSYLIQGSYTVEALQALMKKPQDRTAVVAKAVENLGGSLTGLWLSFGDQDIVALVELPNNVSAAALALAIAAGGALKSTKTTPLLTVAQATQAMKKAASSGYTPVTTA